MTRGPVPNVRIEDQSWKEAIQDRPRLMHNRREFLTGTASLSLLGVLTRLGISKEKKRTRVILLGTKGGPRVGESGRSNPSTLILINDIPYVVDCGLLSKHCDVGNSFALQMGDWVSAHAVNRQADRADDVGKARISADRFEAWVPAHVYEPG